MVRSDEYLSGFKIMIWILLVSKTTYSKSTFITLVSVWNSNATGHHLNFQKIRQPSTCYHLNAGWVQYLATSCIRSIFVLQHKFNFSSQLRLRKSCWNWMKNVSNKTALSFVQREFPLQSQTVGTEQWTGKMVDKLMRLVNRPNKEDR